MCHNAQCELGLMLGTGSLGRLLLDIVAFGDVYWRLAGAILHSVSWVNVRARCVGSVLLDILAFGDVYWILAGAILQIVS